MAKKVLTFDGTDDYAEIAGYTNKDKTNPEIPANSSFLYWTGGNADNYTAMTSGGGTNSITQSGSSAVKFSMSDSGNSNTVQMSTNANVVENGKWYRLCVDVDDYTSGRLDISVNAVDLVRINSSGKKIIHFRATGDSTLLFQNHQDNGVALDITLGGVRIQELSPLITTQTSPSQGKLAVSFWMKHNEIPVVGDQTIIGDWAVNNLNTSGNVGDLNWRIYVQATSGRVIFSLGIETHIFQEDWATTRTVYDNHPNPKWHHYFLWFDGSQASFAGRTWLYKDGQLTQSVSNQRITTYRNVPFSYNNIMIGSSGTRWNRNTADNLNASLHNIALWFGDNIPSNAIAAARDAYTLNGNMIIDGKTPDIHIPMDHDLDIRYNSTAKNNNMLASSESTLGSELIPNYRFQEYYKIEDERYGVNIAESWTNGSAPFNTLTSNGLEITSMINNDGGTDNVVHSNPLTVPSLNDSYRISFDVSGSTLPTLANKLMFKVSPNAQLNASTFDGSVTSEGSYVFHTSPQTGTFYIGFRAVENVNCSISNFKIQKVTKNGGGIIPRLKDSGIVNDGVSPYWSVNQVQGAEGAMVTPIENGLRLTSLDAPAAVWHHSIVLNRMHNIIELGKVYKLEYEWRMSRKITSGTSLIKGRIQTGNSFLQQTQDPAFTGNYDDSSKWNKMQNVFLCDYNIGSHGNVLLQFWQDSNISAGDWFEIKNVSLKEIKGKPVTNNATSFNLLDGKVDISNPSSYGLDITPRWLPFDGSDERLKINRSFNDAEMTISMWLRLGASGSVSRAIFSSLSAIQDGVGAYMDSAERVVFCANDINSGVVGPILSVGVWKHIAITYDSNVLKLYDLGTTNGYKTANHGGAVTTHHNNSNDTFIGYSPLDYKTNITALNWLGDIADFAYYDKVLTEGELLNICEAGVSKYSHADAKFWYTFGNGNLDSKNTQDVEGGIVQNMAFNGGSASENLGEDILQGKGIAPTKEDPIWHFSSYPADRDSAIEDGKFKLLGTQGGAAILAPGLLTIGKMYQLKLNILEHAKTSNSSWDVAGQYQNALVPGTVANGGPGSDQFVDSNGLNKWTMVGEDAGLSGSNNQFPNADSINFPEEWHSDYGVGFKSTANNARIYTDLGEYCTEGVEYKLRIELVRAVAGDDAQAIMSATSDLHVSDDPDTGGYVIDDLDTGFYYVLEHTFTYKKNRNNFFGIKENGANNNAYWFMDNLQIIETLPGKGTRLILNQNNPYIQVSDVGSSGEQTIYFRAAHQDVNLYTYSDGGVGLSPTRRKNNIEKVVFNNLTIREVIGEQAEMQNFNQTNNFEGHEVEEKYTPKQKPTHYLDFDGTDDWIDLGRAKKFTHITSGIVENGLNDGLGDITVIAWVKIPTSPNENYGRILSFDADGNGNRGWYLRYDAVQNKFNFAWSIDNVNQALSSAYSPTNTIFDSWVQVVATFERSTAEGKVYLNGSVGSTVTGTALTNLNTADIGGTIGCWKKTQDYGSPTTDKHFHGSIGDIKVYRHLLSSSEFASIRKGIGSDPYTEVTFPGGDTRSALAWWNFDDILHLYSASAGGVLFNKISQNHYTTGNLLKPVSEGQWITSSGSGAIVSYDVEQDAVKCISKNAGNAWMAAVSTINVSEHGIGWYEISYKVKQDRTKPIGSSTNAYVYDGGTAKGTFATTFFHAHRETFGTHDRWCFNRSYIYITDTDTTFNLYLRGANSTIVDETYYLKDVVLRKLTAEAGVIDNMNNSNRRKH